jgi:SAM-dependent methyltransferase
MQPGDTGASLPGAALLQQQAAWLAPMRARVLRRAAIAQRQRVLDLGAGYGAVTEELTRRAGGAVYAFDIAAQALAAHTAAGGSLAVCADGALLPFPDGAFDLVFCQCVLMWVPSLPLVVREIWRVLQPDGVVVALEPDYGGMLEHPPEIATRPLWEAALRRAGANPHTGRILPGVLADQGFTVQVDLLPHLVPPAAARFDFLRDLPLSPPEQAELHTIEQHDAALADTAWGRVVHLPFVVATGRR